MTELEGRLRAIEEYIAEFVKQTRYGVFRFDSSILDTQTSSVAKKNLQDPEIAERRKWAGIRCALRGYYTIKNITKNFTDFTLLRILENLTATEMLRLRVAPPLLSYGKVATRTMPHEGRGRRYPDKIYFWEDFESKVGLFRGPAEQEVNIISNGNVLFFSLEAENVEDNEDGERAFVRYQVLLKLQRAGWLKQGTRNRALDPLSESQSLQHATSSPRIDADLENAGLVPLGTPTDALDPVQLEAQSLQQQAIAPGKADHFLIAGENKIVPIEFKTTQNLLVPAKAGGEDGVVHRYNEALEKMRTNVRTTDWANIAHAVGQPVNYMVEGESRFGVLSSGTRTYFFMVVEYGTDGAQLLISDAWFIEDEGYLRAWAYVLHRATIDGHFQYPKGMLEKWKTVTPVNSPDQKPSGRQEDTGGKRRPDDSTDGPTDEPPLKSQKTDDQHCGAEDPPKGQHMAWLDPGLAPSIPRVDAADVKLVRPLGVGNNLAFLALWQGKQVAVKIFDVYKDFESFENELRAYEHLKDAWGVLVPEPYFIADRASSVVLGMQLGRSPNDSDTEIKLEWDVLFRTLRCDYGFDHLDEDPRNVIYLPDASGTGSDRLAAIDLEAHKILR